MADEQHHRQQQQMTEPPREMQDRIQELANRFRGVELGEAGAAAAPARNELKQALDKLQEKARGRGRGLER